MAKTRKKPLCFDDLMAIERVFAPAIAPDGTRVAFYTTKCDHKANDSRTTIRVLDMETKKVRELTPGPGNHSQPAWSPDGASLAFVSTRDEEQGAQLWVMPANGGEARRLTSGYGGVGGPLWSPDSMRIAFERSVVVSGDYTPGKGTIDPKKGPARAAVHGLCNEKSSARTADSLLFRHWDGWRERRRKHLFICDVKSGRITDITPFDCDVPPISLGTERDYDFAPDGREVAYLMNPDAVVARSTNNCVFVQKLCGIKADGEPRCIADSEARDAHPRYSADGAHLFYLAMQKPGYEADRFRIKQYNRASGVTRVQFEDFDRSPHSFVLDGKGGLIFLAEDRGGLSVYCLELGSDEVRQLTAGSFNHSLRLFPDGERLLVCRETSRDPTDLYTLTPGEGIKPFLGTGPLPARVPADAGARAEQLTRYGDALSGVKMNAAEDFWFKGAGGRRCHGYLIKPPQFRAGRRYPLVYLIHGGPQGAWSDHWHYRWNLQMFAARGAVVAAVNPRGSTGYGQRFTDQISRDWGGRCYRDLMLGLDFLVDEYDFIDGERVAAAGASFGGFMVNWIAGHTDRFKALVCHDGIFNAETMAYTTEELWFEDYEHGGMPHEGNRREYTRNSPHCHVQNFRTPTLVVQGEQDFRCPASEGLGMFTALQVQGVESRLLWFPDEGHWVMQPANAEVWHDEVLGWLERHLQG